MANHFDSIVIGAGAAGLACARDLSGAGKRVCVLEARERVGGRIFTIHIPDLAVPIELGAEFIHGEAHETFAIVEAAALAAYQLPDNHWWSHNGRWDLVEGFWEQVERVLSRIRQGPDRSFVEFLKTQRLPPRLKAMVLSYVEGYNAAHADRMSAQVLRTAPEESSDNTQFRIANGYDTLIEWLRAGLDPERTSLRLGSAVTEIRWRKGYVEVRTVRGDTLHAPKVVVTVPIGVLKAADGIRFDPPLRAKHRAIEKIGIGHVVRIVFRFRERFWDEPDFLEMRKRGTPLTFVHSPDAPVPAWWTSAPVRAPILTGWAGGHAADRLLLEGHPAERALDSLSTIFAMKRRDIDRLVDSAHMHDWQTDPFSRGAYSYAEVGGKNAAATLAKSIDGTLFFAGEATSSDQTATVAGAIATGKRAAKQVLKR